MKVLLVKPHSDIHVILPPLGLGYLAAYCQKEIPDIDLKILDCHREHYTHKEFRRHVRQFKPDVVGLTALTIEIKSALRYASIAKETIEGVTTIIGGAHASAAPHSLLANSFIDYVFRGESEIGFTWFLKNFRSPDRLKAPGLAYRDGDNIVLNRYEFVDNLDELPFPDYKRMEFEKYPKMYFMKRFPAAPIMSSRGCPFMCTFCAGHTISGRKWRARSVGNIIEEIEYLCREYDIKEIDFWDDNFTLNTSRTEEFCRSIEVFDRDLIWWCPNGVHLNTLNRGLLMKMKMSGCYAVAFGVESASEKIQKDIKKNLSLKRLGEMVTFSHKIGLRTQGFFILGYPTENEEDLLKTIAFSQNLPFLRASFCLFQPIVGSEIHGDLVRRKIIAENDGAGIKCDYSKASIPTDYIKDTSRIKRLQRKAILSFYLRPKIFFRLFLENMTFSQIRELWNMAKKYVFER